jgi:hypothetical protein
MEEESSEEEKNRGEITYEGNSLESLLTRRQADDLL